MRSLLVALALSLVGATARAQDTPDALIDRGFDLREHGDDEGALRLFTQAYEAGRSARALAQMGLAEQALGRWVLAEQHVQGAVEQATDTWIAAHRAVLVEALQTIRARLATLDLRGGVDGAEVLVDGEVVGRLPLGAPLRLVAGTLQVEVRKDGYLAWSHTVVLQPGESGRETVALHPRPAEPVGDIHAGTSTRPSPGDPGATLRTLGWVGIGVGAAAAVLGVVSVGLREMNVDKFNGDACLSTITTRLDTCHDAWFAGHTNELTAIISLSAAGALGIVGLVLLAIAPGAPPPDAAPPATSLACGPGPGEIGVGCAGTF